MLLPLIVFLFVTGLIVGAYFAAVPATTASRELDRRLREVATPSPSAADAGVADGTILKRVMEGPLPALDRLVAQAGSGSRLARLIEQSGVKTTGSAVVMFSLCIAVGVGLLAALFVPQPLAAPRGAAQGAV